MKSKLIYRAEVGWGWLGRLMFFLILMLNLLFLVLIFQTSFIFIFFGIPIFLLDIMMFPLIKSILKMHEFELHTDGVKRKKSNGKKSKV